MSSARAFYVGEALVGKGNEISHIDLIIGPKDGPAGVAFTNGLARQSAGHSDLFAVLTPNLAVKPATLLITKVTIKGSTQAVQMFGPGQAAVAWAVTDEALAGTFKDLGDLDDLVVICGVFIHWEAKDNRLIFEFNYEATRLALRNAVKNGPSLDEIRTAVAKLGQEGSNVDHPFKGDFDLATSLGELRKKFPVTATCST